MDRFTDGKWNGLKIRLKEFSTWFFLLYFSTLQHCIFMFVLVIVWLWGQFGINSLRFILTFFEIARTKWGWFQKTSKWTEGLFFLNCEKKSYYSGLIVWQISTKYKSCSLSHSTNLQTPSPFCFVFPYSRVPNKRPPAN